MVLDLYFVLNMLRNIIFTFFQNGIWVVGFFYLLIKTFESDKLKRISKYITDISLMLLFLYSILVSI